jgi:hypothetical protein
MNVQSYLQKRNKCILAMVVLSFTLILSNCSIIRELPAPQRTFTLEDLLVGKELITSNWSDLGGPTVPLGNDLCSTECIRIAFGKTDSEVPMKASEDIYRFRSIGIAQSEYYYKFLPNTQYFLPDEDWYFKSRYATQSFFGCYTNLNAGDRGCLWGGQYDEFIVEFYAKIIPGEMSVEDMEKIIIAIDERIVFYLGITSGTPTTTKTNSFSN